VTKNVGFLVIFFCSFSSFASKITLEVTRTWHTETMPKKSFSENIEIPIGEYWNLSDQKESTFGYKLKVDPPNPKQNNLHTIRVKVYEKKGDDQLVRSNATIVAVSYTHLTLPTIYSV